MSLDSKQVQHIAMLARLDMAENDADEMVEKLSRIVDFVDQLAQVDTTDVVPMAHPTQAAQRLRTDAVTETDQRDFYQQNAPETASGHYLVPKVIE